MTFQGDSLASSAPPLLLRGGTILTLDAEATVLQGDVLVEDGRIRAVGRVPEPPPAARVLDVSGCFVLPGLVQGHLHLGQTFFRGLAENRRLLAWLRERIWPLEAAHDDESAYWCALLGAAECLLGGTTTIQDIGIGPGMRGLLDGIAASGLRAFAGLCLMDSGESLPEACAKRRTRPSPKPRLWGISTTARPAATIWTASRRSAWPPCSRRSSTAWTPCASPPAKEPAL